MTNQTGQRVRLTIQDWLGVITLLVVQGSAICGVGVAAWTRLAVLETKVERLTEDVRDLKAMRVATAAKE